MQKSFFAGGPVWSEIICRLKHSLTPSVWEGTTPPTVKSVTAGRASSPASKRSTSAVSFLFQSTDLALRWLFSFFYLPHVPPFHRNEKFYLFSRFSGVSIFFPFSHPSPLVSYSRFTFFTSQPYFEFFPLYLTSCPLPRLSLQPPLSPSFPLHLSSDNPDSSASIQATVARIILRICGWQLLVFAVTTR